MSWGFANFVLNHLVDKLWFWRTRRSNHLVDFPAHDGPRVRTRIPKPRQLLEVIGSEPERIEVHESAFESFLSSASSLQFNMSSLQFNISIDAVPQPCGLILRLVFVESGGAGDGPVR